jgi:hypothetical protein
MSLRPPRLSSGKSPLRTLANPSDDPLAETLDQEILAEKFGTYSRLVDRLERAIAALGESEPGTQDHEARFAAASEALYHVVVQRDLLKLPATERFLAELGVPPALRARVLPPRMIRRRRR